MYVTAFLRSTGSHALKGFSSHTFNKWPKILTDAMSLSFTFPYKEEDNLEFTCQNLLQRWHIVD